MFQGPLRSSAGDRATADNASPKTKAGFLAAYPRVHPSPLSVPLSKWGSDWWRETDSNRRSTGYEPVEMPLLHPASLRYR